MRSPCVFLVLSVSLEFWKSGAVQVTEQQKPGSVADVLHANKAAEVTSSSNPKQSSASSNLDANINVKAIAAFKTQKAATPKDAKGRAILAAPTPDGHTAQVSPVHPNGDREWYPEGGQYEAQDGVITEQPDHAPVRTFKHESEKSSASDPPERRSAFVVACFALLGALAFGALPPPLFAFL